ncbi:MAG TPA: hypothetical protein VFH78_15410, partial [Candidatus Thermoplasmatota archaeon]|nr:hypothetical protein [Candidatus Thermoplasmatota archaeon]
LDGQRRALLLDERAAEAEAALWATLAGPFALVEEQGATLPVELDDAARAALQLAAWTTEARLQGSCARAVPPVALDSPALQPVVSNLSAQPEVGERFEEVWSQARHSRALCARVLQERDDLAAQTVGGIEGLPLG